MIGQSERRDAEPPRTSRGLDRLIFFTDAVVAIAITLIALPLVDSAREVDASSAAEFFSKNTVALLAAGISFAVISAFWREHHALFERATSYTPLLLRVNSLWLTGIVAIPVATVLLVYSHRNDRLAIGVYLGLMVYSVVLTRLIEVLLYRAGLLSDEPSGIDIAVRWVYVAITVLVLALGIAFPRIGMWWLFLLFASSPIQHLVRRRLQPGTPAE
ncbi:TMEM175 family protein [Nocardia sp. BMG111209]|uniref:TMEM175 family protein n=1 Tax=Nocardia sp. BMG111209 TaxID=1160137 RepID=UPI0003A95707|nr:TMEM175 family protein [Nocardia sp. BMG111209]